MIKILVLCGLVLLCAAACMFSCTELEVRVASYNVENLFDGADDGTEYREYDPGLGKWTPELYKLKLDSVIRAIRMIKPLPDILCLQEIENRNVLDSIGSQLGYGYRAVPSLRGTDIPSATTVGILSRFIIKRTASHQLPYWEGEPVRDILEAEIDISGLPIVVFVCHWKSRSGGAATTEPARRLAATTLNNRIRTLLASRPGLHIMIAGDMNESYDEYNFAGKAYQTALMPEEYATADSISSDGSLFLADSPAGSGFSNSRLFYFEPWFLISTQPAGSYVYQMQWQALDHILLSGDFTSAGDIMYKYFFVHTAPELVWEGSGFPRSWEADSPFQGASDHLPVVAVFQTKN